VAKARLQVPAKAAKRRAKPKGRKKQARGKPFNMGFDPRRNMKGPLPEVHELKQALLRDGPMYLDALFRAAMAGEPSAIKVAVEQLLGRPPASIEVSGKNGGPIEVKDARQRLAERIAALAAGVAAAAGDSKSQ
jgi:hypothetical protein